MHSHMLEPEPERSMPVSVDSATLRLMPAGY